MWVCDLFDLPCISSIIPVQFIKCRTVSLIDVLDNAHENALFVIPFINFELYCYLLFLGLYDFLFLH